MNPERQKKLSKIAHKWEFQTVEELLEFKSMVHSGPWKVVQEAIRNLEDRAQGELEAADSTLRVFRSQGELTAIRRFRKRIQDIIEEVNDAEYT